VSTARDRAIWALVACAAAVAGGIEWFLVRPQVDVGRDWSFWWTPVVTAGFLAAELLVVHLRIGREAYAFSLMEMPLVVGLFFVRPDLLVVCRVAGAALVFVWERRPLQKALFNCSLFALETVGAVAIWNAVRGTSDVLGPQTWLATGLAVLFTSMVSSTLVSVAITIATGTRPQSLSEVYGLGQLGDLANACFALVAVYILYDDWRASWLLLVVTAVLVVAYRSVEAARQRTESLEQVNHFIGQVGRHVDLAQVVSDVLEHVRDAFEARLVQLRWASDGEPARDWVLGEGEPHPGAARLVDRLAPHTEGGALLVPRHTHDPAHAGLVRAERVRDCLLVSLHTEGRAVGSLVVADKLGDTSTFTERDLSKLQALANHAAVVLENTSRAQALIRQAEEREHLAMHDELTGLANRRLLGSQLATALGRDRAAVLLMDLDRFAQVNNNLGHAVGDRLLRLVADRIREAIPERGVVARLGGDEFAVLLPDAGDPEARSCADDVRDALARPFDLDGIAVGVELSIGVAVAERDADPVTVLRWADLALYSAKERRSGLEVFRPELDGGDSSRLGLLADLRDAISERALSVHYQPQVDIRTGDVVGAEALVRWQHPRYGALRPDEFIPLAEHSSLITPLTMIVLETALRDLTSWSGPATMSMAVNMSPRSLLDPGIVDHVRRALENARVAPSSLTLEITENSLMTDPEGAIAALESLRALGVRLSIDDLGTGYSSLAYLQRLPVDEVKIDRSFVMAFPDAAAEAVVGAIVDLAHRLQRHVVAEGVERAGALVALQGLGCDVAQGYHIARPMPADRFAEFLDELDASRRKPLHRVH
jgi:diguanylate cyclase (GGDEF)-like protein